MADKFRRTEPLNITFSEGEQPDSGKLNAIVTQSRTGSRIIEKAIGDIWNQAGDGMLIGQPLQIPNLGRTIGKNKFLNPSIVPTYSSFVYVEKVYPKWDAKAEGYLTFPPASYSTFAIGGSTTGFSTLVANEKDVDAAGKYWIDRTTGRFRIFQNVTSGNNSTTTISYTVDPTEWTVNNHVLPSIIPDRRQSTFTSCRVQSSGGVYYLHLPPRQPLTFDYSSDQPTRYPNSNDVSNNLATSITPPNRLWQSSGVAALASYHYRYQLPRELGGWWNSLSAGDALPDGFMYLYDLLSATIIEDVVFRKPTDLSVTNPWVIEISSATFDLAGRVGADETQASYNASNLVLITPGSSITANLFQLYKMALKHDHSNGSDFASPIGHNSLVGLFDGSVFQPSAWVNDNHPQYMHRKGALASNGRDNLNNAFLGDFLISQGNGALGLSADSYRILFGTYTGPSIMYKQSESGLKVLSQGDDYGLIIQGDTTSPVRAPLRIVPVNALPSGPNAVGDIVVYNGKLYICSVAGTPGTWTIVGTQT